jgi:hypothetical protein
MRSRPRITAPLGELVAAAFDGASRLSRDPREVSRLAALTVLRMLARAGHGAHSLRTALLPDRGRGR